MPAGWWAKQLKETEPMGVDLSQDPQPLLWDEAFAGELARKFQTEVDRVARDLVDPTKKPTAKRAVVVKLEVKPDPATGTVQYRVTVDPTLAKGAALEGIGRVDERGDAPTLLEYPQVRESATVLSMLPGIKENDR